MSKRTEPIIKIRWWMIILFILLLLVVSLRLAMRSNFVLDFARGKVETMVSEQLNGDVAIGRIEGDLWSHLSITDINLYLNESVSMSLDQSPVVSIDSLWVGYSVMDLIFRRPFQLDQLHIFDIKADLEQDDKENWNVLRVLPESEEVPIAEEEPGDAGFPFIIKDLVINGSDIRISSQVVLPETVFALRGLSLKAVPGYGPDGFFARLDELAFSIHEDRLKEPVAVSAAAEWDGIEFTLDQFVVAGALSLISMQGTYHVEDISGDMDVKLDPLSWEEVKAWMDEWPLRQDLEVQLTVSGTGREFHAGLSAHAPGLEGLELETSWMYEQEPVLTALKVKLNRFDSNVIADEALPKAGFRDFELVMDGFLAPGNWSRTRIDGELSVHDVWTNGYGVDHVAASFAAIQDRANMETTIKKADEQILFSIETTDWYDEDLSWALHVESERLNPALWVNDDALEGMLSFRGDMSGRGMEPGKTPWVMSWTFDRFRFGDSPEVTMEVNANLLSDTLETTTIIRSDAMEIATNAWLLWREDVPSYAMDAVLSEVDLSVIPGFEDITTNIGGTIHVIGKGFDLPTMDLEGAMRFDQSVINDQRFGTIQLDFLLENGWLHVEDAEIYGRSADAKLTFQQNLLDMKDIQNRLDFELNLKDLSGFANLVGADEFQLHGKATGRIRPHEEGDLILEANADFQEIRYDSLHVQQLKGSAALLMSDDLEYLADMEVREPSYGSYSIMDIHLITDGRVSDDTVSGSYDFRFNIESESGMRTKAEYRYDGNLWHQTHQLDLKDPAGEYTLQEPFLITMSDGLVATDTLNLKSNSGAEILLHVKQHATDEWTGFLEAKNTDLGQAQYVFLDSPYFEALFSGKVAFHVHPDEITLAAQVEISEFSNDFVELDSMHVTLDINEKMFLGDLSIWHNEFLLVESKWFLPIDIGSIEEPDPEFLAEEVSGFFRINPFDVGTYEPLLDMAGLEETRGLLSFETTLTGTADIPELEGHLRLLDGQVSGVQMDTLMISWAYLHETGNLMFSSRVHSLGQTAADITATVPVHIDIPERQVSGPAPDDPIEAVIYTDDFNLAAFNDFLNPEMLRNLQGRLNADVTVGGTLEEPLIDGHIQLRGGQFRLVENNITIRQIESVVELSPKQIVLERLSAQSVGSFEGDGIINMDGMALEDLSINLSANNFRVFNTRDFEIYAGLDLRLTGNLEEPALSGDVIWERGTLYLDNFGDREIEEVRLDEEPEETEGPDFYERMEMEVRFSVDRNAFVRSRSDPEIYLAPRGVVDLVKQPYEDIQIFGDMGISSGYVTTFNKRFRLERGDVQFSGDPMDPELNIRTLYQPRQQYEDINIYYIITGTLLDPQFAYESEPEMELQDIISYTLFGRPFHALAGWEQTVSGRSDGSMATNIAVDILIDRIETLASDRLGIDVIEIESNNQRSGGGTTIKAGKFISDRLFVAFLQELGGSDAGMQMMIEYMIRRNLDLIITAGDDYRSGVDMLWRYDY